jgi:hypothetical protein
MSTPSGPPPGSDPPPLLPSLRAEPRLDAQVRASLRVLRDSVDDEGLRHRMDDVLAGRSALRDLARSADFAAVMDARIDTAVAEFEAMSEQQRAEMLARFEGAGPGPAPDPGRREHGGTW